MHQVLCDTAPYPKSFFPFFVPLFFPPRFAVALSVFLLGTLGGYRGDDVGMGTAVEDTASIGQTRQQCSQPSSSCIRNPVWVVFGTPAGWCHLLCCRVFARFMLMIRFCIRYGSDDDGIGDGANSQPMDCGT